ncbi:MAG: transketolase [Planctomycetia bacterium]|nr:transketolase [Planctomycetia bacterium]
MNTPAENLAINTIRTLSMDAVQAANSGHPGTPMALAPVGYLLFNERMKYDPAHPEWIARDRFVLSCGHASMLLYSLLHLSGVQQWKNGAATQEKAVPLDHIKRFRQMDSRCPGHPEFRHTSGVEVTTGPLGQGLAMSVGMALGSNWLGGTFHRDNKNLLNYNVYALCGDGDMMEGVASEAASLAGHMKLSNLCWIYDDNSITIEGNTELAFSENVAERFQAYGWNVIKVNDVNDLNALRSAFDAFLAEKNRPTLIIVKSIIGYGSPNKAGSHEAHGAPLGEEEIKLTKKALGWDENAKFYVPDSVYQMFSEGIAARGADAFSLWQSEMDAYASKYPAEAKELQQILSGELPENWDEKMTRWNADAKGTATRNSSGKVLNQLAENLPWLIGGSADLGPSNKSVLTFPGAGDFSLQNPSGRNFHFGIREFAMAAIINGMATTGLRCYCATFFVFADYLRAAARLSCIMELPVLYLFTHDSIGVGEDGPTHQPVEHLASLRAMPNMIVMRPADANEVRQAYKFFAKEKHHPISLVLTRQDLPTFPRSKDGTGEDGICHCACGLRNGAYILRDAINPETNIPDIILMASGSEVHLCLEAQNTLRAEGIFARVVSCPSLDIFETQTAEYQESVLPKTCTKRIAVEAGIEQGWRKYIGLNGTFIGMTSFGASAPFKQLYEHFGITTENIIEKAKNLLK